jgi:hypothetical protein
MESITFEWRGILCGVERRETVRREVYPDPLGDDGLVRFFHGTTVRSAQQIMADGFRPIDVKGAVSEVGQMYGIDPETLFSQPGVMRYLAESKWRDEDLNIHFSFMFEHAASYARRGCEVAYFAREAAFGLLFPDEKDRKAPARWAMDELAKSEEPAVVILKAPLAELPDYMGAEVEAARRFYEFAEGDQSVTVRGPAFAIPVPIRDDWITGMERVAASSH